MLIMGREGYQRYKRLAAQICSHSCLSTDGECCMGLVDVVDFDRLGRGRGLRPASLREPMRKTSSGVTGRRGVGSGKSES